MKNIVNFYVEKFKTDHRKARRMASLLLTLALVVTLGVFWQLHATGIALTNETYCGLEEHEHTGDCYESVLVCGQEESEGHAHDASCYDEAGDLTCGLEESEGHTHTEVCYEEQLVCGMEEHTHTISCMSDETADVETASDWEKTLPDLTGVWAEDVVAVAESQLGYTESTANFTLDEDGETRRGYTRYGAWAGNEYGDWDAMFASFCLYYAGVDKKDFPEATGAYAWSVKLEKENLYADAADCDPVVGNLVFFDTDKDKKIDRVGIITAVDEKKGKLTVIEGDSNDAVEKNTYSVSASEIVGYGVRPEQVTVEGDETAEAEETEEADEAEETFDPEESLLIAAGESGAITTEDVQALIAALPTVDEVAAMTAAEQLEVYVQLEAAYEAFCMLTTEEQALMDASAMDALFEYFDGMVTALSVENQDIEEYAAADEKRTFTVTVYDSDMVPIQADDDGEYSLTKGEAYYLQMVFTSTDGMDAGTYYYTIPDGFTLAAQTGTLKMTTNSGDTVEVGEWVLDAETGVITFTLYEEIESYSNITLTATVSGTASGTSVEVGDITYEVVDPTESETLTVDKTTTSKGADIDAGKIYWRIKITGGADQGLAGGVITDTISNTTYHWYTEDDIEGMYLTIIDADGKEHYLSVSVNEVTWSKDSWSYTLPESFYCSDCGTTITLPAEGESSAGWTIRLYYTSTMQGGLTNYTVFGNEVTAFDQTDDSETSVNDPNEDASIVKTGEWNGGSSDSDDNDTDNIDDAYFSWAIEAVIPGTDEGDSYTYMWYLYDSTKVDGSVNLLLNNEDMEMEVTATFADGTTITLPQLSEVTDSDTIAWKLYSTDDYGYNRTIRLWSRCDCTEDTCGRWSNGHCDSYDKTTGFCQCWCLDEPVTLTITYKTSAVYQTADGEYVNLIDTYAGHYLKNSVSLNYRCIPEGKTSYEAVTADSDSVSVDIPGMLNKELTEAASSSNGQVAAYSVTINEAMVDLSDLESLTIVDTMTYNLAFMEYTLAITAKDADGNIHEVTNYTLNYVAYDATDSDAATIGNVGANVATITIDKSELGPYMYTVTYNASYYLLAGSSDVTYTNQVEIEAYGNYSDQVSQGNADAVASGETYSVQITKVDADNAEQTLEGAVFGVYTESGVKMAEVTTDENGLATVKTDYAKSIIFHEHTLYYLQEIEAPEGYALDSSKYYFWFCNVEGECTTCDEMAGALKAARVDSAYVHEGAYDSSLTEEVVSITVTNEAGKELPETGGSGTWMYALTGLVLCGGAGLVLARRRRVQV